MARCAHSGTGVEPARAGTNARRYYFSTSSLDALRLDADERQMLTTLQALGRAGLVVGAADGAAACPAFRSRWCRVTACLPRPEGRAGPLGAAILSLLDEAPADVVICADDGTIEAIRARRDEIERRSAVGLAAEPALAIAVSKERTLAMAREVGLALPRGVAIPSPEEVGGGRWPRRGCPRSRSPTGRGWAAPAACAGPVAVIEARKAIDVVTRLTGAVVQQWLPGRREAVSLVRANGQTWARFAQVAYRMLPAVDGSSVVRESIPRISRRAPDALARGRHPPPCRVGRERRAAGRQSLAPGAWPVRR
jgi:hypothetical protein